MVDSGYRSILHSCFWTGPSALGAVIKTESHSDTIDTWRDSLSQVRGGPEVVQLEVNDVESYYTGPDVTKTQERKAMEDDATWVTDPAGPHWNTSGRPR